MHMAYAVGGAIQDSGAVSNVYDLVHEDAVAPSCMGRRNFVAFYCVSERLAICLNFDGEAPYGVGELI